ncbi:MAG: hypothetical protein KIC73_01105 [Clostridiales bacterium]|nr:hypothetical protein [Clostridiales bacterium]
MIALNYLLGFVWKLRNRLLYYGIFAISFFVFIVYCGNLVMLNGNYNYASFSRHSEAFGKAAATGILLIIGAILLILGCASKWIDVIMNSSELPEKLDGIIRTLIAIGAGVIWYTSFNVIVNLVVVIIFVTIVVWAFAKKYLT